MVLLPEDPAGLVVTRTAGRAVLNATLSWRDAGEMPQAPILSERPPEQDYRRRTRETEDPASASRTLEGEVLAPDEECLARALEETLRGIMGFATLTEAVLEARSVRTAVPWTGYPRHARSLARELRSAGFTVRFGWSWTVASVPDADVYLGTGGDSVLERFVTEHPALRSVGYGS